MNNSEITKRAAKHWQNQEIMLEEWTQEQFIEWSENLAQQGLVESPQSYQDSSFPSEKTALTVLFHLNKECFTSELRLIYRKIIWT